MRWDESLNLLKWEKLKVSEPWPPNWKPRSGVYRLVMLASSGGLPMAIPRVCGEDISGTLYIGQAGSLEGRVNELRKTLRPDDFKGSHGAGKLLLGTEVLKEKFATENLETKWALCDNPQEIEQQLLNAYAIQFGEGPPLNRQRAIPTYD
jgi:hypothetical protein